MFHHFFDFFIVCHSTTRNKLVLLLYNLLLISFVVHTLSLVHYYVLLVPESHTTLHLTGMEAATQ